MKRSPSETLSKFAIFLQYEKLKVFFFILCNFIYFFPNECPAGLCRHKPGHSLAEKVKLRKNKAKTILHAGFRIPKVWQTLKFFTGTFHQA